MRCRDLSRWLDAQVWKLIQGTDGRYMLFKAARLEEISWGVNVIRNKDFTLQQVIFRDLKGRASE